MSISAKKKPVVMRSIEDATGDRCVDLLQMGPEAWGWVECRRDPEDAHGWRRLGAVLDGFESEAAARADAARSVGWLEAESA